MNPQKYTPPTPDLELLRTAGLQPTSLMALSALEHFTPLGDEQIKNTIGERIPSSVSNHDPITDPFKGGSITGKEYFNLTIDQEFLENHPTIRITNCKNFSLRGSEAITDPSQANRFLIEITGCEHFLVEGISCSATRNMLFISDSSMFTVRDCRCSGASGAGVIVHEGHDFTISGCLFDNNLSAGILIVGNSYNGEIHDCTCTRSRGFLNQDAGIHLCSTSTDVRPEHIPDRCHEALPITGKTQRPHHIVIRNCTITHCRAQGIYLEGAVNCLVEDNVLVNNNKEGVCFDWGSCYNIFHSNTVSGNGERRNLSPEEIKIDFISDYPLLEDGSSSMKLPGISLDNGCMNLICENTITCNHGGGIKMIRTALFNSITRNGILYNAIGSNEFVPFFHGITVLGIGAVNREFESDRSTLLDFTPSILNSVTLNTIKENGISIFSDKCSSNNLISGNIPSQNGSILSGLSRNYFRAKSFAKRFFSSLPRT